MLIKNSFGQFLLVTRRNSTEVGLPGGKVDEGETFIEAAVRETFEETGISFDLNEVKEIFSDTCIGDVNYVTKCFSATYDGNDFRNIEEGITPYWGSSDELLYNSPFKEYNAKLFESLEH